MGQLDSGRCCCGNRADGEFRRGQTRWKDVDLVQQVDLWRGSAREGFVLGGNLVHGPSLLCNVLMAGGDAAAWTRSGSSPRSLASVEPRVPRGRRVTVAT